MALMVTGAAGFIGSNLVKALNARGERDIIAVDNLARADKVANLADLEIVDFVDKRDLFARIDAGELDGRIAAVLHQGACSDTMETDGRSTAAILPSSSPASKRAKRSRLSTKSTISR